MQNRDSSKSGPVYVQILENMWRLTQRDDAFLSESRLFNMGIGIRGKEVAPKKGGQEQRKICQFEKRPILVLMAAVYQQKLRNIPARSLAGAIIDGELFTHLVPLCSALQRGAIVNVLLLAIILRDGRGEPIIEVVAVWNQGGERG